ncbi:hypothetical protein BDP27DRAFT_1417469 [Rhodocollybia butyracea]|uniref:Uncharacterized protein n=1 Tax=Rhodocollybia butyracea TaxID=206335 RepID=A0A9P5UBE9_9AGAR|nr:hypothetical protein BDP27DRAFT_1417469 [Rhodocollybia butyracea]
MLTLRTLCATYQPHLFPSSTISHGPIPSFSFVLSLELQPVVFPPSYMPQNCPALFTLLPSHGLPLPFHPLPIDGISGFYQ